MSRAPEGSADGAGSSTPSAPQAAGAPGAATRRGATARATRAPSAGQFRPKAVRRDEADRDTLARQEEQKAVERAAEERRARGRSRYRSKRNRGDAMGSRGGWGRGVSTASGPFSGGFSESAPRAGRGWFGGGGSSGGFGGGSAGGFQSGASRPLGPESKGFGQSDASRTRETRINADKLHAMTPDDELDSDDEAMMAALSNRAPSALPMGIHRREPKETGLVVATTAELEAAENANGDEESLWVDGDGSRPPAQQPEEQGIWDPRAGKQVLVKKEADTEDPMDLDAEIKTRPAAAQESKPVVTTKKKNMEPPQDAEEKTIQADMQLLASELGALTVIDDGKTKTEGPTNKDGRMYLFQFPPLIPPLKQVGMPEPPRTKVKEEPQAFSMLDTPVSAGETTRVDLTREDSSRQATGAVAAEEAEEQAEYVNGFRSQPLSQGGMVGKLNIRRSGRVELDWGGMRLEMSPAAGMNFPTTAVIVDENDEKPQHDVVGGESIGMGKIMGRFVLAPVWNDEEEWNVAPHELAAG